MSRARDLADSADLNFDDGTLVIDSGNNRVGIGTASPALTLDVAGRIGTTIAGSESDPAIQIDDDGANMVGFFQAGSGSLGFSTNGSEAMRINSSGNLSFGKTDTNATNPGIVLNSSGRLFAVVASDDAVFNRTTTDGSIISLRKDGTTVGSIGTTGGDATIGTGIAGFRFRDSAPEISPHDITANAVSDGLIDLGAGARRFKDLYLSGGVYLGGTGSANKLEDYEEGTWTPTYQCINSNPTITYSSQTGGTYQKIGRAVFVTGRLRTVSVSGGSGTISIGGLPFAVTSGVDGDSNTQETTGAMPVCQCEGWSGNSPKVIEVGTSSLTLFTASSSDFQTATLNTTMNATDFSSGGVNRIRFAGFYLTDS